MRHDLLVEPAPHAGAELFVLVVEELALHRDSLRSSPPPCPWPFDPPTPESPRWRARAGTSPKHGDGACLPSTTPGAPPRSHDAVVVRGRRTLPRRRPRSSTPSTARC